VGIGSKGKLEMLGDEKGYPFATVLQGRPILPGFDTYRGLTVRTFPKKKNPDDDEKNIFCHLGSYFIWPFSFNQLKRIKEWAIEYVEKNTEAAINNACQKANKHIDSPMGSSKQNPKQSPKQSPNHNPNQNQADFDEGIRCKEFEKLRKMKVAELKAKCKDVSDALNKDNAEYRTFISFVAENLLPDSATFDNVKNMQEYERKSKLEEEIRKRYDNIIDQHIWAYICDWIEG
jgi:hypothetical protein